MRNLLREEFYKSNKGITQYICAGVAFLSFIFLAIVYSQFQMGYHWADLQAEFPWLLHLPEFVVVFVMVYICNEFAQYTIRNYISLGIPRNEIYFAKLIKVGIITLSILIVCQILSLTFLPFIFSGVSVNIWGNIIYYLYGILAMIECICFYVAIAFVTRSVGIVIAVYFGLSLLVGIVETLSALGLPIFGFLLNLLQYAYFDKQANLAFQIAYSGVTLTPDAVLLVLLPVIISVVSTLWGLLVFNKADVK